MLCETAASRNSGPILEVLKSVFKHDRQYKLLEIASGSGQHIVHFAQNLPNVTFQPSELNPRYLHSIVAYVDHYALPNIRVPLNIDVSKQPALWALPKDFLPGQLDVLLAINMIHYSSEKAIEGLFKAANGLLKADSGKLVVYGPFAFDGMIRPQSNVNFDFRLRQQNHEFGLRDIDELDKMAQIGRAHV